MRALHIDRRQHLEIAWQRQQGEEALLKQQLSKNLPVVAEVRNLAHLDQLVESAGSAVILLYLYSKVNEVLHNLPLSPTHVDVHVHNIPAYVFACMILSVNTAAVRKTYNFVIQKATMLSSEANNLHLSLVMHSRNYIA